MTKLPISIPSRIVEIETDGQCDFCGKTGLPLLTSRPSMNNPDQRVIPEAGSTCESCARFMDWYWRRLDDAELAGSAYPQQPGASLVLIVKDNFITTTVDGEEKTVLDYANPLSVLMVGRKEEPGVFGLPGGKVDPGETAVDAAVRELHEETSVEAWPQALKLLYRGYSPRGRMVDTYVARVYGGEPRTMEEGVDVAWKPWPPTKHAGILAGYYSGMVLAYDALVEHRVEISADGVPLCQPLGRAALQRIAMRSETGAEARRLADSLSYAMSEEEKAAVAMLFKHEQAPPTAVMAIPKRPKVQAFEEDIESSFEGEGESEP